MPNPEGIPPEDLLRGYSQALSQLSRAIRDSPLSVFFHPSNIQAPEGLVVSSQQPDIPVKVTQLDSNSGWQQKAWNTINPNSGQPFRFPVMVRVDVSNEWSRTPLEERVQLMRQLNELMQDAGITSYGAITTGAQNHVLFKSVMDRDAPPSDSFNLDAEAGDWMPASENPKPDTAGKMLKRDKSDGFGAGHHFTEFTDDIPEDVIPISGDGGRVNLRYTIIDEPVRFFEPGKDEPSEANVTDGGGDIKRSKARQLWDILYDEPYDGSLAYIQVNWQVRGQTMKAMLPVIEDAEYLAMTGDPDIDMRISSDGLASQLANNDFSHGRTIFHRGKAGEYEWRGLDGLLTLPSVDRYFDLDQFGEAHFNHMTLEAMNAVAQAEEAVPMLRDTLDGNLPRGIDDNGRLEPGDPDYDANLKRANTIAQQYASQEHALQTGSLYSSVGLMDAMAGKTGQTIISMRKRGAGALGLQIPVFTGKQTAATNLPGYPEPERGEVRLVSRPIRDRRAGRKQAHFVVFNNEDMADPEYKTAHDGPDNDDEYTAILGRDEDGNIKALVGRSPRSPGGGRLYDVHPEDAARLVRAGMPTFQLRPEAQVRGPIHPDMAGFFAAGNGFNPDELNSVRMMELARMMGTDNPARAIQAKLEYAANVVGTSKVGSLTNMISLAMRSGWIDTAAQWESWAINLSNALDAELWGFGNNERITFEIAEKVVGEIQAGRPFDSDLVTERVGLRVQLASTYAEIRARSAPADLKDFVRKQAFKEFEEHLLSAGMRLEKWEVVNGWFQATDDAVKRIENAHISLANGPMEWLRAYPQPAEDNLHYILPEVDKAGRELSQFWRKTYGQTGDLIQAEFKKRKLTRLTRRNLQIRQEIETYLRQRMWETIDFKFAEVLAQVRELDDYRSGMLMASVTQHELIARSFRNNERNDMAFDHLRPRVFDAFDDLEKTFYYSGITNRRLEIKPTIVIPYAGEPWMQGRRDAEGNIVSQRDVRDRLPNGNMPRRSWVRYRHEGYIPGGRYGLGPFAGVESEKVANHLQLLSDLGAEFRWRGDVGGRQPFGIFEVRFRGKHSISDEQAAFWLEARYHRGIPSEQLPPMWTPLNDMKKLVYEVEAASGRTAYVLPDSIEYASYDNERVEFPDITYAEDLPEHLRREIPEEKAIARISRERTPAETPPPLVPEDLPERPISTREFEDAMNDIDREEQHLKRIKREAERRARDQSGETTAYKVLNAWDDPEKQPARINRVGGRVDSEALLANLVNEMRGVHAAIRAPRMAPPMNRAMLNQIFYSPTLGHFTTVRDVTRAFQDFVAWDKKKRLPLLAPAGLNLAETGDEAASLILKDVFLRAEERFWRHSEFGYMQVKQQAVVDPETGEITRTRAVFEHTRAKTREVRSRVRPSITMRIPTPIAGITIHPRLQYSGYRRKLLTEFLSELEHYEPFGGDPDKWAGATERERALEVAKVEDIRERNQLKAVLAKAYAEDRFGGIKVMGIQMAPGVTQAVDELIDLGVDLKESFKYISNVMRHIDDNQVGAMVRTSARAAMENMLDKMGISTLSVAASGQVDASLIPTVGDMWDQAFIKKDYDELRSIFRGIRSSLANGDWTQAGADAVSINSLYTTQWLKRNTRIYTQSTPMDVSGRSVGRIMPVSTARVGRLPVTGFLDINTIFGDREVNNVIERIKTAAASNAWKALRRTHRGLYDAAKSYQLQARSAYNQGSENLGGIRVGMLERAFDETYQRQYRRPIVGGIKPTIIIRASWHVALTQGLAASALSSALRENNVPMEKRWKLNRTRGTDWDCVHNSRQGWIRNSESFATGHDQPPAHPGCRCELQIRVAGRADSSLNGTLKPMTKPRFLNLNPIGRREPNFNPLRARVPRELRRIALPEVVNRL